MIGLKGHTNKSVCKGCIFWRNLSNSNRTPACHFCLVMRRGRDADESGNCKSFMKKSKENRKIVEEITRSQFMNPDYQGKGGVEFMEPLEVMGNANGNDLPVLEMGTGAG